MSTAQLYLTPSNASAATFRAWAEGISLQMTAAGWTKTTDTGQVDWTTNPAVPANDVYVYEIRRPASDPLQTGATAYYIKIEYGMSSSVAAIRFSIGTGTNGAGTLTGFIILPTISHPMQLSTTPVECNFSWDASRFAVLLFRNYGNLTGSCWIGIERTKDTTGADTSEGVTLIHSQQTNGPYQRTLVFGVGLGPAVTGLGLITWLNPAGTLVFNSNVPVSPAFPCYGKWGNPMTIFAACPKNDVGEGVLLTTTLYGVTRTYLVTKALYCLPDSGTTNQALLLRFD